MFPSILVTDALHRRRHGDRWPREDPLTEAALPSAEPVTTAFSVAEIENSTLMSMSRVDPSRKVPSRFRPPGLVVASLLGAWPRPSPAAAGGIGPEDPLTEAAPPSAEPVTTAFSVAEIETAPYGT